MKQKNLTTGTTNIANLSGKSLATLLGVISPNISITIVITAVETEAPWLPRYFVNTTTATDEAVMLTMLLPISIVDISFP